MTTGRYWLTEIGSKERYAKLLDICAEHCPVFSLVLNEHISPRPSQLALNFIESAKPFVIAEKQQDRWPGGGNGVPGETSRVVYMSTSLGSMTLLKSASGAPQDWVHPDLPEDLAFYRPDDSVFFAIIAHERVSFLDIDLDTKAEIEAQLPGLDLLSRNPI